MPINSAGDLDSIEHRVASEMAHTGERYLNCSHKRLENVPSVPVLSRSSPGFTLPLADPDRVTRRGVDQANDRVPLSV